MNINYLQEKISFHEKEIKRLAKFTINEDPSHLEMRRLVAGYTRYLQDVKETLDDLGVIDLFRFVP